MHFQNIQYHLLLTKVVKEVDDKYYFYVFCQFFENIIFLFIDKGSFLLLRQTLCGVMGQHLPCITLGRVGHFCLGFARSGS